MNENHSEASPVRKSRFYYGYIIVLAGFAITMVSVGCFYSIGVFFKPMLYDFGWSRAVTSGPISFCLLINGLVVILMGRITDKIGPRLVGIVCALLSGIGYILMSQITSVWQLYLFYGLLIGAGTTCFLPLLSTAARWFDRRRTAMTGIVVTGGGIGGIFIPMAANWLIAVYNWRTAFIVMGITVMVVVLISSLFLKNNSSLEPGVNRVKPDIQQTGSGFTLGENFISRQFWLLIVAFFCFGFCLNAMMVHIVPHITDLKISPTSAAGVLSTINGMSIVGNLLLGIVADRVGNKRLFIGTFILEALVLAWLVGSHSVAGFYLFGAVFGLAIGGAIPQESPLIAYIFGMRTHGTTLTVISLGHSIGAAIGSFLAGYVFDLSGSYQPAFIICAGICIIGMLALVTVRPLTHK